MKIAILSLNPGYNYGGILQSYALKTVLERMGHEVSVISRTGYMTVWSPKMFLIYAIRLFRRFALRQPVGIFYEKNDNEWLSRIYGKMLYFSQSQLHLRLIKHIEEIKENEFDAFVVGSDQVWRPQYFTGQFKTTIADAYLKFAEGWDIRRVAYAPSFGVDEWEYSPEEAQECARLLKLFNGISVREQAGVTLCREYFNIDAICLCDPTMLLSRNDYESLVDSDTPKSEGNMLVYCLDKNDELDKLVNKIATAKSLVPFSTNVDESTPDCEKGTVESWIRGFMDAEFVVTDSFHACVFALIFHKPFVVFGNRERGLSRFESLLSIFHQEQRLLRNASDFNDSLMNPISEKVDETFAALRKQSTDFLTRTLQ